MLDPKNHIKLTKEFILSKVDEETLFKYYISGFKKVNTRFSSELRKDTNPSCIISNKSGRLIYIDFGNGQKHDIFSYIQEKYRCTFLESLKIINNDFNCNMSSSIISTPILVGKLEIPDKVILYRSREFNQRDYDYWMQYNITEDILQLYKIRSLSHFWIDNNCFFVKDDLCYLFPEIKKDKIKYKIYRPLQSKDKRFISNDGGSIYGLRQLPEKGDCLFITSSKKDIMSLRSLGYYSISFTSETVNPSDDLINYLKERWNKIFVFYDFDKTGIEHSNKLVKTFNLNGCLFTDNEEVKDPSDYIKKYGKEKLKCKIKTFLES